MSLKNCLIVLWVYIMYVLGLWIFLSGYLLKRIVVHKNSTSFVSISGDIQCGNITSLHQIPETYLRELNESSKRFSSESYLKRYNKAVFIIIDALRYDFVINDHTADDSVKYYRNKMPIFKEIVKRFPHNSLLLPLIADPPTTTLQRLKGLTTGSLPTFIDVSLNFASTAITEDNWIWQMKTYNKNVLFLGDDTWISLFPNQFYRSYPYPSFNVKDLDTVDNGILSHIYEELENNESHVIIAHFLGVDHCGHRYGPRHPEMSRKLLQMNHVIKKVIDSLKNDTLLLVLGDHGMTESGDHGGDSISEIKTVLFAYSPSKLTYNISAQISPLAQIDIVPTLCLLLGLPIPYSNLGSIIPEVFSINSKDVCFHKELDPLIGTALAAAENCIQIQRYLNSYSYLSNELSQLFINAADEELKKVSEQWYEISLNVTKNKSILLNIAAGYMSYLQLIKSACAKKWATFNIELITAGAIVFCFTISCNFWIAEQLNFSYFSFMLSTLAFIFMLAVLYVCETVIMVILTAIIAVGMLVKYWELFIEVMHFSKKALCLPGVVIFMHFLASFSNSFLVHEDRITLYLAQALIVYRFFPPIVDSLKSHFTASSIKTKVVKRNPKWNFKLIWQPLLLMCLVISLKIGTNFYKCREEQIPCTNSDFIISLEKLHGLQSYKVLRLLISLTSVIAPVIMFLVVINYKVSNKTPTVTAVCIKYGIFFVCVCTSLRWWLNIVPPDIVDRILKGNEVVLTRAASVTSIIMCTAVFFFPILSEKPWEALSKEIYNTSLGSFLFIFLQLLYLIAGDALAPTIMLMSFSILCYILLSDFSTSAIESETWIDVIIWFLLSRHWFYGTAHQATFSSIQWDAAFLFSHKEVHSYALSCVLVILNTFCSNVLHGLALPLILTWTHPAACSSKSLLRLHMKYLFCCGFKLLGTICASIILQRHLMVWKIFTPKLLYEVVGIIISMASVSISHYFTSAVTSKYHILIRKNYSHNFANKNKCK